MILTSALFAAAGCDLIPKRDRAHASPAAPAAPAAAAPVPPNATPPPAPASASASAVASASKPPALSTPAPFSVTDKKFLDTAARILAYQRRLGSLAKQYGNSDESRNLGGLMEEEMALAGENLKTLANSKKQQAGAGGGWGHGGLERLASQRGEGFDRNFYEEVKQSGAESYAEFDQAFRAVKDGDVRVFARDWYPVLRNYPREAIKLELKLDKKRR